MILAGGWTAGGVVGAAIGAGCTGDAGVTFTSTLPGGAFAGWPGAPAEGGVGSGRAGSTFTSTLLPGGALTSTLAPGGGSTVTVVLLLPVFPTSARAAVKPKASRPAAISDALFMTSSPTPLTCAFRRYGHRGTIYKDRGATVEPVKTRSSSRFCFRPRRSGG